MPPSTFIIISKLRGGFPFEHPNKLSLLCTKLFDIQVLETVKQSITNLPTRNLKRQSSKHPAKIWFAILSARIVGVIFFCSGKTASVPGMIVNGNRSSTEKRQKKSSIESSTKPDETDGSDDSRGTSTLLPRGSGSVTCRVGTEKTMTMARHRTRIMVIVFCCVQPNNNGLTRGGNARRQILLLKPGVIISNACSVVTFCPCASRNHLYCSCNKATQSINFTASRLRRNYLSLLGHRNEEKVCELLFMNTGRCII